MNSNKRVSTSIRRPRLNKWLRTIEIIIKQDNYSLTQLSIDIRKDLSLVHRWVVTKTVEPGGEATIQLIMWAIKRRPELIKQFRVDATADVAKRLTKK